MGITWSNTVSAPFTADSIEKTKEMLRKQLDEPLYGKGYAERMHEIRQLNLDIMMSRETQRLLGLWLDGGA